MNSYAQLPKLDVELRATENGLGPSQIMQDFLIAIFSPAGIGYTLAVASFSGYCGHRLNLFRDKRNEFNSAVDPIRDRLIASLSSSVPCHGLSPVEIDGVRQRSGFWQWHYINKALSEYERTKPEYLQDECGQPILQNALSIHDANRKMVTALNRR